MERLQKVIAHAGITSRRKAEEFILAGRVKVNGQVVRELGIKVGKHDTVERIYPVGRLDYDTSGILLLTNDGDFAQRLTHPKHEVDKVYVAKVKGIATKSMLAPLTKGIKIEGRKTSPAKFQILSVDPKTNHSIVELTIHEGRNHQVKNMLQAVGLPVQKLKREKYGDLTLQGLRPGDYRELNKKEVSSLLNHSK